jgi:hypothetical protein
MEGIGQLKQLLNQRFGVGVQCGEVLLGGVQNLPDETRNINEKDQEI